MYIFSKIYGDGVMRIVLNLTELENKNPDFALDLE